MPHSPHREEPEEFAFGQATEKLRDSLTPRPEVLVKLLQAIPGKTVTNSASGRLFREEAPKPITWLSMLQNHWPRYAFALVAILAVVGMTFGLSNRRSDTAPNPIIGSAPETSPTETSGTPSTVPNTLVSADAPIDTVIAEATAFSDDDFAEEDSFETGNDAEEDALLISLYESYDEDTL